MCPMHPEHLSGIGPPRPRGTQTNLTPEQTPPGRDDVRAPASAPGAHTLQNALLGELPPRESELLLPRMQRVTFGDGEVVRAAGEPITALHFPETSIVSWVLVPGPGRRSVDAATIGCEGVLGVQHVLGGQPGREALVTRVAGTALRIAAGDFDRLTPALPGLVRRIERYAGSLLGQMAQTALCVQSHTIEQRLAGLILSIVDRDGREPVMVTHEQLGLMLGIRRPGITHVASILRERGLVEYRRGRVTVTDHAGLTAAACDCHRVIDSGRERQ